MTMASADATTTDSDLLGTAAAPAEESAALDLTNLEGNPEGAAVPDSSRSYATVQRYRNNLLSGLLLLALVAVAIALSVVSLQKSNEALNVARANEKTIEEAGFVIDPEALIPPSQSSQQLSPPAPTPKPSKKPTEPPHPLSPKWFHTNHEDYITIKENNEPDLHPWLLAGTFCHQKSMFACDYDAYCPRGAGQPSFEGGPPIIEYTEGKIFSNQWSPIVDDVDEGYKWVQVGEIPVTDGGRADDNFGVCKTWEDWSRGSLGAIEEALGDENRQWILCCEADKSVPED